MSKATATPLHAIRLLVLDVDGVLTDGRLYYGADGEELKVFDVKDGAGIRLAQRAGVAISVISGRRTAAVSARCRDLGIALVEQGVEDKVAALERQCAQIGAGAYEALCIVDDTTDLPLVRAVGYSIAVADAHPAVRELVDLVTTQPGGRGAVREVCDLLVAARGARR
jgi:3-deoxy-D-manno-octulosonate 8-phosphate phosphatase (KDO 8-P phosphatase)